MHKKRDDMKWSFGSAQEAELRVLKKQERTSSAEIENIFSDVFRLLSHQHPEAVRLCNRDAALEILRMCLTQCSL